MQTEFIIGMAIGMFVSDWIILPMLIKERPFVEGFHRGLFTAVVALILGFLLQLLVPPL